MLPTDSGFRPGQLLLVPGGLLLFAWIPLGLGSQASSQAESGSPVETLSRTPEAESIRITDEWEGYALFSPTSALWDLHRTQNGFSGTATFQAEPHYSLLMSRSDLEGKVLTDRADIFVPLRNMDRFLIRLSRARLFKGEYVPSLPRASSFPSISIEIRAGQETVTFFTRSQGEDHVPWGVSIGGETYVVVSPDVPAAALREDLEPYLKREVLQELLNSVR